jgi:hypothetical protein
MSISNLATYFVVQVQNDQETKKQREAEIKLNLAYFKQIDKANETNLKYFNNIEEALKDLAKSFDELNKNKDWMKAFGESGKSALLKSLMSAGVVEIGKQVFKKELIKGAFAGPAGAKALPLIGRASTALDIGLFVHEVKDIIDKMNMVHAAQKDTFTLEALKAAIDRGDQTEKLIF